MPLTGDQLKHADELFDRLLELVPDERPGAIDQWQLPEEMKTLLLAMLDSLDQPGLLDGSSLDFVQTAPEADAPDPLVGRRFGPYRLESLIGHGGMSSVYRAVRADGAYDAPVAFKILSPALLAPDWQTRFRREARYLARLRHPGIASLLDAGLSDDGTPFLVTELIEGEPIHRWCEARGCSLRQRLALIVDLCEAVAYAQNQLLVHRDIKSDNVLVTDQGQVKLLDFGIARQLADSDQEESEGAGTRIFTPQYAAPEQLLGQPVSTATDVFSIGVLMYRLITGSLPFAASTDPDRRAPAPRPSQRIAIGTSKSATVIKQQKKQLRGDLDNICTKAMARDPAHRYANARELGKDLQRWLDHRPVSARRSSIVRRLQLFARRRTALATTLAALMLVTVIGLLATSWQAWEARQQARIASSVTSYLTSVFTTSDPLAGETEDPPASELLRRGAAQAETLLQSSPEAAGELLHLIGSIQRQLGFFDDAQSSLEQALASVGQRRRGQAQQPRILLELGLLAHDLGDYELSVSRYRTGLQLLEKRPRQAGETLLEARIVLPQLESWTDPATALSRLPELKLLIDDPQLIGELRLKAYRTLSMVYNSNRKPEQAEHYLKKALTQADSTVPALPPLRLSELHSELGLMALDRLALASAVHHLGQTLTLEKEVFGEQHPRLATLELNLAFAHYYAGDHEQALYHAERALAIGNAHWPEDHPLLGAATAIRTGPLWALGRWQELDEALQILAGLSPSTGMAYWAETHGLLALFSRKQSNQLLARHAYLLGQDRFAELPADRIQLWDMLVALATEMSSASAEHEPRAFSLPESGNWGAQLSALLGFHYLNERGEVEQARQWQAWFAALDCQLPDLGRAMNLSLPAPASSAPPDCRSL